MNATRTFVVTSFCTVAILGGRVSAADSTDQLGPDGRTYEMTVSKAIRYLETKGQSPDGSFTASAGPGVTALVTAALLRHGRSPSDVSVAKSLKYLESMIRDDGGIYAPLSLYRNYETCMAVMCFGEANQDGRYDEVLKNADGFLKKLQWDDDEGHKEDSFSHGGAGYGKHKRPDLSNTSFLIEALRRCGNDPTDPAIQKALMFVSRCQNLESSHNTTPFGAKINDGGCYYTPAAGGKSQADVTANGGLRSYGSMTYQGLKSMIYAGVGPDDERVKAAVKWIQRHYALDANPGMGSAGLYYYYQTFAKTLSTLGLDRVADADGVEHDWRRELAEELVKRQQADGAWLNENSRWLEGDANLATGYALLGLSYCAPQK